MTTTNISLSRLVPFEDHPYQVRDDEEMLALTDSIKEQGVLSPVIARPLENGNYEIISGHRRCHAAQNAGLTSVPAVVLSLTHEEAAIALVDSNLHREQLLPSEKAFAYKLKFEAIQEKVVCRKHYQRRFSMKIGGTVFDVTTHFNAEGRQTVLQQFRDLILSEHFV